MNDVTIESQAPGHYLLSGILTFASVPDLYVRTNSLFEKDGSALTFDLQHIEHTDSAGLALLIEWMRLAEQQNQPIHFANITEQMLSIARVSGLEDILPLS